MAYIFTSLMESFEIKMFFFLIFAEVQCNYFGFLLCIMLLLP